MYSPPLVKVETQYLESPDARVRVGLLWRVLVIIGRVVATVGIATGCIAWGGAGQRGGQDGGQFSTVARMEPVLYCGQDGASSLLLPVWS